MQKKNFGKICSSLRESMFDYDAGRAWSQQDLAKRTGLPKRLIGQIERGEKAKLEADILITLADAFNLTINEKRRFFYIANDVDLKEFSKQDQLHTTIFDHTFDGASKLKQPVLLHDGLYRIIGLNSAYKVIYGLTDEYLQSIPDSDPTKYHFVRHIHDPDSPVRAVYKSQIEKVELNNAIYWKFLSLAHRYDPQFNIIQSRLIKRFPRFAQIWSALNYGLSKDAPSALLRSFRCNHPELGLLDYLVTSTHVYAGLDELFITFLTASDDRTFRIFNQLIQSKDFKFASLNISSIP